MFYIIYLITIWTLYYLKQILREFYYNIYFCWFRAPGRQPWKRRKTVSHLPAKQKQQTRLRVTTGMKHNRIRMKSLNLAARTADPHVFTAGTTTVVDVSTFNCFIVNIYCITLDCLKYHIYLFLIVYIIDIKQTLVSLLWWKYVFNLYYCFFLCKSVNSNKLLPNISITTIWNWQ